MRIKVISVGRIKEKFYVNAIKEYTKRLSAYCKLEEIEVADEKCPEQLSDKEMLQVKEKEGQRILSKIKDQDYVMALAIEGKMISSEDLAHHINTLGIQGKSDIAFIIGGSLGLSDEVMKRSNYEISFSKMTFPHQLMKVILTEQIYRAYKIMKHEPYHK